MVACDAFPILWLAAEPHSRLFTSSTYPKRQDKVDTVLEALSYLELPASVVIEFFLASSSATLLPKLGTKVGRCSVVSRSIAEAPTTRVTDNSMPSHHLNTHLYIHTRNSSTAATAGTGSCASAACSSRRPSRSRRRTSASTRSCSTTGRAPVRACARAVRRESGFVFTIYLCALPMMSHTNLHRITQHHRRRRLGRGGGREQQQ